MLVHRVAQPYARTPRRSVLYIAPPGDRRPRRARATSVAKRRHPRCTSIRLSDAVYEHTAERR
eukprot:3848951-Pyramimonas_sp.AAC.1